MRWRFWQKDSLGSDRFSKELEARVAAGFLNEVARRGLSRPKLCDDDRYEWEVHGWTIRTSLDNLIREFARDRDEGRFARFVDSIIEGVEPLPSWSEARRGIRFAAHACDDVLGDTYRVEISPNLCRVLAHEHDAGDRYTLLNPSVLDDWSVSESEVTEAANENMAALLRRTSLNVEEIDGFRLVTLETHSPFKAALIFSPNLKDVLSPTLGWPIYAVIPCRDFAFF
jgi:hypothetical protein